MNNRTKEITHGALYIALIGVLLILNRQLGNIFNEYLLWILPVPLILYTQNYSVKSALLVVIAGTLLAVFVSTFTTVFYVGISLLVGLVYGAALKKGRSNAELFTIAVSGSLIINLFTYVFWASLFGYSIQEDIDFINQLLEVMKFDMPNGWDLSWIIYASYFVSSLMEGFLIHMITFFVFKKMKIPFPQFKNIDQLKMPVWLAVIGVIVFPLYIYLMMNNVSSKLTEAVSMINIVVFMVSLFFGYITVMYCTRKMAVEGRSVLIVVLLIVALALCFGLVSLLYILALIGIVDGFVDFKEKIRRLKQ